MNFLLNPKMRASFCTAVILLLFITRRLHGMEGKVDTPLYHTVWLFVLFVFFSFTVWAFYTSGRLFLRAWRERDDRESREATVFSAFLSLGVAVLVLFMYDFYKLPEPFLSHIQALL